MRSFPHLAELTSANAPIRGLFESLAAEIFATLERALKAAVPIMKYAYGKAAQVVEDVFQFGKDRLMFCIVALGMLVILMPCAIQILGFGKLGPVEGTFAAQWQSTHAGYVSARSLFSFFQRLGMVRLYRICPRLYSPIACTQRPCSIQEKKKVWQLKLAASQVMVLVIDSL